MTMEKVVITIQGKEYGFLKPAPIDIVEIERKAYQNGNFNAVAYEDALLRIVSKTLDKKDLVKFNPREIKLSSGAVLAPQEIPFDQYEKMILTFQEDTIATCITNYLNICGSPKIDIRSLTKEEVYDIYSAYVELYNRDELDEVLGKLSSFC